MLTGLLPSLSFTFAALFQNQVEWIFPAFFFDGINMPAHRFHDTCSLIRRAYQKTLPDVDLQIYFGDFSCQQIHSV